MSSKASYNFRVGDTSYDVIPGEVVDVNYKDDNSDNLFSVKIKMLHRDASKSPDDILSARPISHNIKKVPLKGEIVLVLRGPTAYGAGLTETTENYYIDTFSIQNGVHHNAIPKRHLVPSEETNIGDPINGIPNVEKRKDKKADLGNSFKEDDKIRHLQNYAGDLIFESRFGSSIRFGSSLQDFSDYTKEIESWNKADGNIGDPIIAIRNGQREDISGPGKFITENIDKDASSIYLTKGQQLKFELASTKNDSISDKNVDSYSDSPTFSGNQIGIFSDRVILNSRKNEIIMFAKNGIGGTTEGNISFDTEKIFEIDADRRINLGLNANEPILLGDTSGDWLSEVLTTISSLCDALTTEIHGTGTGPSTPPINAPQYIGIKGQIEALKARIPTLKSQLAYVNRR